MASVVIDVTLRRCLAVEAAARCQSCSSRSSSMNSRQRNHSHPGPKKKPRGGKFKVPSKFAGGTIHGRGRGRDRL